MSLNLSVYTIGGGDLLEEVFNAIASVFNSTGGISSLTSLAVMLGGLFAVFEFSRSRDVSKLIKWVGVYVLVTSLMLYPKATVHIEDRSGIDIKPRAIDHVPLSLALFASVTSELGIAMTEMIETVFHLPNDLNYNKTGMLMGSKLVTAAKNFQITDPEFSQTLNEFMQQCVFFDLLLQKYTVKDLTHAQNPWEFIKANTSVARAFPLNGEITICKSGAAKLDKIWQQEINNAASIYGGQIMGGGRQVGITLLSRLSDGYGFLTKVSTDGQALLKTNLVANAMSQAMTHYGANANAPAALQAYLDTKTELQTRQALNQTGMQAGIWMQEFTNILQALVYSMFIIVYFLSYFPFGFVIIRNYLMGMFILQSFAPMYAIINFAATFYAQGRSMAFIASTSDTGSVLSISNVMGVAQANVDAMAIAGYLMWPVTIGGAIMLWRGMPGAIQSMGHYVGGVAQSAATHIAAEGVGGNISVGNTNFGNHSLSNTTANHFDSNSRFAAGMSTWQTGTGANISITPSGTEVMDTRGAMSNLGASVQITDSLRSAMSRQAQSSHNAGLNQSRAAGEQYSAGLRQLDDYGSHQSHFTSSGTSHSLTESTGFNKSAHDVSQLVDTFRKEHHVSHERAAQVLAQVYADAKVGVGFMAKAEAGVSGSTSMSGRSAFGSLYNDASQFAVDHNFAETVDSAKRAAIENHYRDGTDQGSRYADSVASSFDRGDTFRKEAASSYSRSSSFAALASQSQENSSSVMGNYTQEFYEWMRTQKAYGNQIMSKSHIDNMAAHDPGLLQSYANNFVEYKTSEINEQFGDSHHLNQGGGQVRHDYQTYSQSVGGQSHVEHQYEHYQETVTSQSNAEPGSLGSINSSIAASTQQQINHDNSHLAENKQSMLTNSGELKGKVQDKVKGQVIGSLVVSDKKMHDAVNKSAALTGYIPLGGADDK